MSGAALHRELGLTDDELEMIVARLGRRPNDLELAMYSVMWSEHCSYKSSRIHLGRLPTEGPRVLVGPGENAGVVDVGEGIAIALRIESHNHPSFVEPYQGAATGVGGILRDIFTMGARPIALMDPLFVGPLDDGRSAYLLEGIVRGIAGYGNAVGVPTVGGQITFDASYRSNPLVNVFCLGVLPVGRLVLGRAQGVGNLAVLLGSRTGRDGIGGVSVLASAGFNEDSGAKRPSVQVGDPYEEKRLIEACLALLDEGLAVGIQDLGGAGLTCATSETAARAGLGMDVDVEAVIRREAGMSAVEVMTSESQERMLAIVTPEHLARVEELCARWEVEASVIGTVTEAGADGVGLLRILEPSTGSVLATVPARSLADEAPRYERPLAPAAPPAGEDPEGLDVAGRHDEALLAMLADPAFIYSQYDHQLFLNTVLGPGEADATLLRLGGPGIPETERALALSCDANPRWCAIDPRAGAAATVAESALNVALVGATPLALVNCLNFGNPEHPSVMWQLSEAIDGMAEACLALSIPVVGGNVSLYNESDGADIDPTPVVTVVGLLERLAARPPAIGWCGGDSVLVLGERRRGLAGSLFARNHGRPGGRLETLDLAAHERLCSFVAALVAAEAGEEPTGLVHGAHDCSEGGLALALAEMAARSGIGLVAEGVEGTGELFSEGPSRVLLATARPDELLDRALGAGIPARLIGRVGGSRLVVSGMVDLEVEALRAGAARAIAGALGTTAQ
ncbi:MAG TPA: phosphoribosylformylglycinamidine synthase subunit PurL [Acidimicrobiales bacterium]|nr:phosphoribosylformylglycinamidine synthase subunit PurL [Acidimicrobiales bacterium]